MAVIMEHATIRERILLHLGRFKMVNEEEVYNLPFDLTQDGIAAALGISRAHSSLELKKLRVAGKVRENQVHVIGSGIRRKVYYLEPEGRVESEYVRKKLEDAGISIETVLDMRRCDPELMWEKLSPSDRDALGLACVIRVPVNKKLLPPTDAGIIPATHEGMVKISPETKKKYLDAVDLDSIHKWNSDAADWWMDNVPDHQERLYHLMAAGRSLESNKLLVRMSEEFLGNCNEDLLEIAKSMEDPVKDKVATWSIKAKIAVTCKDPVYAERCASELEKLGSEESDIVRAEIKLVKNDASGALSASKDIYSKTGTARSAMLTGRSLFALGRYDEAEESLAKTLKKFTSDGDVSRLDEIMILRAGIAYSRGNKDECLSYLGKALRSTHNDWRRECISTLTNAVKTGKTVPVFD